MRKTFCYAARIGAAIADRHEAVRQAELIVSAVRAGTNVQQLEFGERLAHLHHVARLCAELTARIEHNADDMANVAI